MTTTAPRPEPITSRPYPARKTVKGSSLLHMLRTTDPKNIGILYLVTSFGFLLVGGAMALLIRAELAVPGQQFLSNEQYNQLFTMHGTIMLLLYATPILFGFANYIVPLQIGAPDVAFPRLNAFSYWLFLFGGLVVMSGFATPGGAADFDPGGEVDMRPQRVAPVQTGEQQHLLPEVAPHQRVHREVHPGDVDEDRPEKLAGDRAPVELGH